jgi:hypothetical protein
MLNLEKADFLTRGEKPKKPQLIRPKAKLGKGGFFNPGRKT